MLTTETTSVFAPEDSEPAASFSGVGRQEVVRSPELGVRPSSGPTGHSEFITFGRFRLCVSRRLLLEEDRPVSLGGRALEILMALVERPGKVVCKHELVARTWPGLTVEESSLRVQIAALRRSLRDGEGGERYISTVSGRGYSFVAPLTLHCEADRVIAVRGTLPISPWPTARCDQRLCSGTTGLPGRPIIAVVTDADLPKNFNAILAKYRHQMFTLGAALLLIPGASSPMQEQSPVLFHNT